MKRLYAYAPGWMDYEAVAYYTSYPPRAVKRWYQKGLIRASRIGGNGDPRFSKEEIDRFMKIHEEKSLQQIAEDLTNEVA